MSSQKQYLRLVSALLLFVFLVPAQARQQQGQRPAQSGKAAGAVAVPSARDDSVLRFAIVGDTGTGERPQYEIGQRLAARRLVAPFEFVIMLGDNMYGGQGAKDFQTKFEKPYDPLLSNGVRFFASLGNHDQPGRQIAYKPFSMGGERYYTFKPYPDVRFFAIDSNYMDKTQLEWLTNALKNSGSEWKICFFHHPLYSSGKKHGPDVDLRRTLEPLFVKYGVDVVFSGHEHFYERFEPQKGIQYFIVGSSGQLREGGTSRSAITAKEFDTDQAFMTAEVGKDEMTFQTISKTGAIVDSGKIRRAQKRASD